MTDITDITDVTVITYITDIIDTTCRQRQKMQLTPTLLDARLIESNRAVLAACGDAHTAIVTRTGCVAERVAVWCSAVQCVAVCCS